MSISFACTGCGAKYKVPETLGGKKAQCKTCGVVTRIPKPQTEASELGFREEALSGTLGSTTISGTLEGLESVGSEPSDLDDLVPKYDPPPPSGKGKKLLNPLPQVETSELEALGFKSPGSDDSSGGRGAPTRNYASPESYSLLLILAFFGSIAFAIYHDYKTWPSLMTQVAPEFETAGSAPHAMIVVPRVLLLVSAFAVLGPLFALGWFAACKAFNVRLPNSLYMRSVGLAVMPVAIILLLTALPLGIDASTASLIALISVPAAFLLLHYVHCQSMNVSGLATGAGALLLIGGVFVTFMGAGAVQDKTHLAFQQQRDVFVQQKIAEKQKTELAAKEAARLKAIADAAAAPPPAALVESVSKESAALLARLKAFQDKQIIAAQTRESLSDAVNAADTEFASIKKSIPERPEYAAITEAIASLRKTAESLPSEKPPTDLAQAVDPGPDWTTKPAGREVSVFEYNFVPPAGATIVLNTDAKDPTWRWKSADGQAELKIQEVDGKSPDQKRPWVASRAAIQRAQAPVFAVEASPDAKVDGGIIAGTPFTRVSDTPSEEMSGTKRVAYVGLADGKWLTATIQSTAQNTSSIEEMDRAIRTLHKRPDSVAVTDPISVTDLVSRFRTASADQAQAIADILKTKPGAEDTVLRAMGVAPDAPTMQAFGPLLASVATEHAVPTLWKIAGQEGGACDVARTALKTLDPKNADDISFAVMDLKSAHPSQMKQAVVQLSTTEFQKSRSSQVSRALYTAMDKQNLIAYANGPDLETALSKWMSDDISNGMLKLLNDPTASNRRLAIKALAATGNQKFAGAICKTVTADPDLVVETLIAMGPVAEIDVDRMVSDHDAVVRKSGAMVLQEIGTAKSLSPLQSAIGLSGDAEFKAAAKDAVARIKERMKSPPAQPAK